MGVLLYLLGQCKDSYLKADHVSQLSSGQNSVLRSTFFFLAVSAYVAVVTVQRSCRGMGLAAMVLRIERIDCYVNQVQKDLADITVSVWILCKGEKTQVVIPKSKSSQGSCWVVFLYFSCTGKMHTKVATQVLIISLFYRVPVSP